MSTISIAKLYLFLTDKFGEETSENLTNFIDEKIRSEMENNTLQFATKADIYSLKEDMSALKKEMAEQKAETIKWMFFFWIGQMATIFGLVLLYLKK